MSYQQIVDEIRKLNLNRDHTNPNHDKKMVDFFYNIQKSHGIDMVEVRKAMDILTNDFSQEMREHVDNIAYFMSLIER